MKVTASGASADPNGRKVVADALAHATKKLAGRAASYGFLFVSPSVDLATAVVVAIPA